MASWENLVCKRTRDIVLSQMIQAATIALSSPRGEGELVSAAHCKTLNARAHAKLFSINSSISCRLLGSLRPSWSLLESPGAPGISCGLLGSLGQSWALLGSPGASWYLLGILVVSGILVRSPGVSKGLLGIRRLPNLSSMGSSHPRSLGP